MSDFHAKGSTMKKFEGLSEGHYYFCPNENAEFSISHMRQYYRNRESMWMVPMDQPCVIHKQRFYHTPSIAIETKCYHDTRTAWYRCFWMFYNIRPIMQRCCLEGIYQSLVLLFIQLWPRIWCTINRKWRTGPAHFKSNMKWKFH